LFPEDFEAWGNGPVCQALYKLSEEEFSICAKQILSTFLSEEGLTTSQEKNIDEALECYGDKNPQWLSTLPQMEEP